MLLKIALCLRPYDALCLCQPSWIGLTCCPPAGHAASCPALPTPPGKGRCEPCPHIVLFAIVLLSAGATASMTPYPSPDHVPHSAPHPPNHNNPPPPHQPRRRGDGREPIPSLVVSLVPTLCCNMRPPFAHPHRPTLFHHRRLVLNKKQEKAQAQQEGELNFTHK